MLNVYSRSTAYSALDEPHNRWVMIIIPHERYVVGIYGSPFTEETPARSYDGCLW